ncbi:13267_t:CDS:2, partial [Gigaspora rosea]
AERDNEMVNACLQWNLEQLTESSYLLVATPVVTNQAGKKVADYQKLQNKSFSDIEQAGEAIEKIEE